MGEALPPTAVAEERLAGGHLGSIAEGNSLQANSLQALPGVACPDVLLPAACPLPAAKKQAGRAGGQTKRGTAARSETGRADKPAGNDLGKDLMR